MKPDARAVLFRAGGLGDLLVALPAASLVRRALPGFHLTLATRLEYGALFKLAGVVDGTAAFDDPRMAAFFGSDEVPAGSPLAFGWLNRRGDWPAGERWLRPGTGRAFFVPYDPGAAVPMSRYFFERTLDYLRSSATAPLIASSAGFGEAADETKRETMEPGAKERLPLASTGDTRGLFDGCAQLTLGRKPVERALAGLGLHALGPNERRLIIHPGSGGRAKRWPLGNFVDVIRHAAARGLEGVLVTGEAEADIDRELRGLTLPAGWARASCLAAETLAGLLAASTHYIGNDSGPTHLAAACGATVLAIFRDENLPAWRPFGRTIVLSAPTVERVPLEAVLGESARFFERQITES